MPSLPRLGPGLREREKSASGGPNTGQIIPPDARRGDFQRR